MSKLKESQLDLRFLRTFALAAERLVSLKHNRDISVLEYNEYLKTMSSALPALENMAWKMNMQYDANILVSNSSGLDSYGRFQAFADLSALISEEMKQKFTAIRPWYDGNLASLPQQLNAAMVNLSNPQNKYWLDQSLILSVKELELEKIKIREQMYNEIEQIGLSERVAVIMENCGLTVSEEQDDDLNDILREIGNEFLSKKNRVDNGEAAVSLRDRIGEDWNFSDEKDVLLFSLVEPMEKLGQVVRHYQRQFRSCDDSLYYLNKFRDGMTDVPSHQLVLDNIYPLRKTEVSTGIKTWADGKVMPAYLDGYDDGLIQKINTESSFWKNYEDAGVDLYSPEWKERIGLVLGGWSQMLWEKTGEMELRLDDYWDENFDSQNDVDDEYEYFQEPLSEKGGENTEIFKEDMLSFAHEFLVMAEASEKYLGIKLNDSGISQQTLDHIAQKEGIDEDAFRVFELIIETFDKNYDMRDFFKDDAGLTADEDSKVFIDKLSELPHSPAKREVANMMLQSFEMQKLDVDSEDEIVTDNFIEQIELVQRDKYEILEDFVDYAIKTYPELSGENPADFTDKLSASVSENLVIPLYLGVEPYSDTKDVILENLDGYEHFSPEAKKFMGGLIHNYFEAVKPLHEANKQRIDYILLSDNEQLLDEDVMALTINEYIEVLYRSDDLQQQIDRLQDVSQGEEAVYRKYSAFQEKRDVYHITDDDFRRMLMNAKIFVR